MDSLVALIEEIEKKPNFDSMMRNKLVDEVVGTWMRWSRTWSKGTSPCSINKNKKHPFCNFMWGLSFTLKVETKLLPNLVGSNVT